MKAFLLLLSRAIAFVLVRMQRIAPQSKKIWGILAVILPGNPGWALTRHETGNLLKNSYYYRYKYELYANRLIKNGKTKRAAQCFHMLANAAKGEEQAKYALLSGKAFFLAGRIDEAMEILKQAASCPGMAEKAWIEVKTYALDHPLASYFHEQLFALKKETLLSSLTDPQHDKNREIWLEYLTKSIHEISKCNVTFENPEHFAFFLQSVTLMNHDGNHREMREEIVSLMKKIFPDLNYISPSVKMRLESMNTSKIRLGFLITRPASNHFNNIIMSIISLINRNIFTIILVQPKIDNYIYNDDLNLLSDEIYYYNKHSWEAFVSSMLPTSLDILLHENVVFNPIRLTAFARFAPVQCNFLDRLEGYGAPNEDYTILFGKKEWIKDWRDSFNEKMVILKHMYVIGNKYETFECDYITKKELGLSNDEKFFFTWHTLSRWSSEYDIIITTLLKNNPEARLLCIAPEDNATRAVLKRWKENMPDIFTRIKALPYQTPARCHGIMQRAEVLLAPPTIPGTNSMRTAMIQGLPVVVATGTYIGARIGEFFYHEMGIHGLIAHSTNEYINIAQRLLDDVSWRLEKQKEISDRRHLLFMKNSAAIKELELFLISAYKRVRNNIPSEHWVHGKFLNN